MKLESLNACIAIISINIKIIRLYFLKMIMKLNLKVYTDITYLERKKKCIALDAADLIARITRKEILLLERKKNDII